MFKCDVPLRFVSSMYVRPLLTVFFGGNNDNNNDMGFICYNCTKQSLNSAKPFQFGATPSAPVFNFGGGAIEVM